MSERKTGGQVGEDTEILQRQGLVSYRDILRLDSVREVGHLH